MASVTHVVPSSVPSSLETTVAVDEMLAPENVPSEPPPTPPPPPTTTTTPIPPLPQHFVSTSAKKLQRVTPSHANPLSDRSGDDSDTDVNDENNFGYVFMDTEILISVINNLAKCEKCGSNVKTMHELSKKQGFAHFFRLVCTSSYCDYENTFATNKLLKKDTSGRPAFDVNLRSIVAFREIGKGHSAMTKFCGFMNMPKSLNKTAYNDSANIIKKGYTMAAQMSMSAPSLECRKVSLQDEFKEDSIANIDISTDGAWQRRGYASLNGLVTIIAMDTNQCVDFEVVSKICKSCEANEKKKGTEHYETFKTQHDCQITHHGSAGSMEGAGVIACFKRSLVRNQLRYTTYIGDGDSSSYASVVKANPYPGIDIINNECVCHVQKRVGSRWRNLKKQYTIAKTKLDDKKGIGSTGRLTDAVINKLQNYFGLAIRNYNSSIHEMKKAIGAVLYHCPEGTDSATRHRFCPRDERSWCKYWQAHNANTLETYVESKGLPVAIRCILRPIFDDLARRTVNKMPAWSYAKQ